MLSGVRVSAVCPLRCGEGRRRDDSFHRRRSPPATGTGSGWFGAVGHRPGEASMTTPRTGRPRRPARSRMASRLLRPSALLIHLRLQRTARVDFHQSASASSTGVRRCTIEAAGTHGWLIDVKQAPSATRRLKTTARTGERGAWFRVEGGNSADTQCQHEAAHGQTGAGRDESGFEKDTGPRDSRPSGRGGASSGAPARRAANDDRRAGVLPRPCEPTAGAAYCHPAAEARAARAVMSRFSCCLLPEVVHQRRR